MPPGAKLSEEMQRFIVASLACYDTPSEIAEMVKERWEFVVTRQAVFYYDAEHNSTLPQKWRDYFYSTRKEFLEQEAKAAVASQQFRLRGIEKIYQDAMKKKNRPLALQALEQAAKDKGGIYTSKRTVTLEDHDSELAKLMGHASKEEYVAWLAEAASVAEKKGEGDE